jgi:hypothetical protein
VPSAGRSHSGRYEYAPKTGSASVDLMAFRHVRQIPHYRSDGLTEVRPAVRPYVGAALKTSRARAPSCKMASFLQWYDHVGWTREGDASATTPNLRTFAVAKAAHVGASKIQEMAERRTVERARVPSTSLDRSADRTAKGMTAASAKGVVYDPKRVKMLGCSDDVLTQSRSSEPTQLPY